MKLCNASCRLATDDVSHPMKETRPQQRFALPLVVAHVAPTCRVSASLASRLHLSRPTPYAPTQATWWETSCPLENNADFFPSPVANGEIAAVPRGWRKRL
jgi:hypothetical protein